MSVTEANVREYLSVTTQMKPIPVFELVVSPGADCREVDIYRNMAKQILKFPLRLLVAARSPAEYLLC